MNAKFGRPIGHGIPLHAPRGLGNASTDAAYERSARERQRREALDDQLEFLHQQRERLRAARERAADDQK